MANGHGVIIQSGPTVHGLQVMVFGPFLSQIFIYPEDIMLRNVCYVLEYYFISSGQSNDEFQKHVAFNFDKAGRWNNEDIAAEKEFVCQYTGEDKFLNL